MKPTAVWLYGSTARGDRDSDSDVDILAIGFDDHEVVPLAEATIGIVHLSRYQWHEIEAMHAYGSLFLLHVGIEGRELSSTGQGNTRLRGLLDALPKYARVDNDVLAFTRTLKDVDSSIRDGGSLRFEASVLCTTMRHAAILGCYVLGSPRFDRRGAFEVYLAAIGMNAHINDVCAKYERFRSPSTRVDDLDLGEVRTLMSLAQELVSGLTGICHDSAA